MTVKNIQFFSAWCLYIFCNSPFKQRTFIRESLLHYFLIFFDFTRLFSQFCNSLSYQLLRQRTFLLFERKKSSGAKFADKLRNLHHLSLKLRMASRKVCCPQIFFRNFVICRLAFWLFFAGALTPFVCSGVLAFLQGRSRRPLHPRRPLRRDLFFAALRYFGLLGGNVSQFCALFRLFWRKRDWNCATLAAPGG